MVIELEEGDVVLCTVEKVERTIVFVNIEENGEGSIVINEIAPGRIRNIRDYVVPKKKIVCKVLRIKDGRIELSLRRVTQKERKEVVEEYKKEKSYLSVLKTVLGEKAEDAIKKISEKGRIFDFLEESKEDSRELEKIISKENSEKVLKIIKIEKQKKVVIKKEIILKTHASNGLEMIKEILGNIKGVEVKYISGGKYSLKIESSEPKKADKDLKNILEEIKEKIKGKGFEFSIKEK